MIAAGVGGVGVAVPLYGEIDRVGNDRVSDVDVVNPDILVVPGGIFEDIDEDDLIEAVSFDSVNNVLISTPIYHSEKTLHVSQIDLIRKVNHQLIKFHNCFRIEEKDHRYSVSDRKLHSRNR